MSRRVLITALALAACASAVGLLAAASTGSAAAHRTYTFAFVGPNTRMASGGRAAAKALGVRYIVAGRGSSHPGRVYTSLVARHVDAIAAGGLRPRARVFAKVRKAGILLISSGHDIAAKRDLWANPSPSPVAYAHALADALASQVHEQGEYAILGQSDEDPIADTWAKLVAAYISTAYPRMKSDGVIRETGDAGSDDVKAVKSLISDHPNLNGLIGITPGEAMVEAMAITQARKIGQVFSAGNGGDTLDFADGAPRYVRNGAAEFVYGGDTRGKLGYLGDRKLGYLTVWGADHLLTGHHFKAGSYEVGGPVGRIQYYGETRELSRTLTISKANLARYTG